MKGISTYVNEKLKFGKDFRSYGSYSKNVAPDTSDELKAELISAADKCDGDSLDLNYIDVSNVDDFYFLFSGRRWINNIPAYKKLSSLKHMYMDEWDVSNAWNFNGMFNGLYEVEDFGISDWNVEKAENMALMFNNCKKFNEDISKWRTPKCSSMNSMFYGCHEFKQDLSQWKTSSARDMRQMFAECQNFNSDLSGWDLSNIQNMEGMFHKCYALDQDFEPWAKWKLKDNITNGMFYLCHNQETPSWYDGKK